MAVHTVKAMAVETFFIAKERKKVLAMPKKKYPAKGSQIFVSLVWKKPLKVRVLNFSNDKNFNENIQKASKIAAKMR